MPTTSFPRTASGRSPGRFAIACLALLTLFSASGNVARGVEPDTIVDTATLVLDETMAIPAKAIPESLLRRAEGVAIIPNVLKVGLIGGVSRGRGVVLVRNADGQWGEPSFVTITGGSVGFQIGAQATDLVLVFCTPQSVQGLMNGKLTIGADASAAAGPLGRTATAATDGELKAEIYSYSRSRGLFAGVALDGSVLQVDSFANGAYFAGRTPESAVKLVNKLNTIAPWPNAVPRNTIANVAGSPAPAGTDPAATSTLDEAARNTGVTGGPATGAPTGSPAGNPRYPGAPDPFAPGSTTASGPDDGWKSAGIPALGAANGSGPTATQSALVGAAERLDGLIDDRWKSYLALPPEIVSGAPSWDSLHATLQKYDSVANNPAYVELARRPEFREIHRLLVQLLAETSRPAPAGGLRLPPPPTR